MNNEYFYHDQKTIVNTGFLESREGYIDNIEQILQTENVLEQVNTELEEIEVELNNLNSQKEHKKAYFKRLKYGAIFSLSICIIGIIYLIKVQSGALEGLNYFKTFINTLMNYSYFYIPVFAFSLFYYAELSTTKNELKTLEELNKKSVSLKQVSDLGQIHQIDNKQYFSLLKEYLEFCQKLGEKIKDKKGLSIVQVEKIKNYEKEILDNMCYVRKKKD